MIKSKRGNLSGLSKCPGGSFAYDSNLERDYALELENDPGVKAWTKEHGIKIPYRIFWILPHSYWPDFLVTYADGSQEVHETKGAGFLSWASTHAKRRAGDEWCRKRGMIYRFIENSWGALFVGNGWIDRMEKYSVTQKERVSRLEDL